MIDAVFHDHREDDREPRRDEAILRLESVLTALASDLHEEFVEYWDIKMELDQGIGFYLLHADRDLDVNPGELLELVRAMTAARDAMASEQAAISRLLDAILRSAGALPELESAVDYAERELRDAGGEMDNAEAILTRQIIMAERLYKILTREL